MTLHLDQMTRLEINPAQIWLQSILFTKLSDKYYSLGSNREEIHSQMMPAFYQLSGDINTSNRRNQLIPKMVWLFSSNLWN